MLTPMGAHVLRRNNVTVSGPPDGPPMIFAHGFGCDQNMWRFVAPAFADRYRTVLFDFVGAGASDLAAYDPGRYGQLAWCPGCDAVRSRRASVGQNHELRMIWPAFSPGCSRTPYSALALIQRIICPR